MEEDTYQKMLFELFASLKISKINAVIVFNGHGGNTSPLRTAVMDLRAREGIRVAVFSYWDLAAPFIRSWRRSEEGGINHACEMETALMLHTHGPLVHMDKAVRHIPATSSAYFGRDLVAPGRVVTGSRVRDRSDTGVMGDPTLATPERGRELCEAIVVEIARFLEEAATWP